MHDCGDAEYHFTREAQELRRAWGTQNHHARRRHIELANHHRLTGLSCLFARASLLATARG
jgi:hypothetical protein